jgi:hypothetical protein
MHMLHAKRSPIKELFVPMKVLTGLKIFDMDTIVVIPNATNIQHIKSIL